MKQIRGLAGKMNNIELQSKIMSTAKYLSVVESLIACRSKISITKLIVISYIYVNNNFDKEIFGSRTKKNLFDKYLALLTMQKEDFLKSFEIVFDCVLILLENDYVSIGDNIILNKNCKRRIPNNFLEKLLNASNTYSDSQILREILNYV